MKEITYEESQNLNEYKDTFKRTEIILLRQVSYSKV